MKGLTIVLGMGKPMKGGEPGPEDEASPMADIKLQAAKEALAAFKANDAKALMQALDSFVQCCSDEGMDPTATERPDMGEQEMGDEE